MLIFKRIAELQSYLSYKKECGTSIGFVPTMGALHEGHLSLLRQSKKENQLSVCSIFVNPTQFNEKKDLKSYPRMFARDIRLLAEMKNDVVFMPEEEEIYPQNPYKVNTFEFGELDKVMEGEFRPGHFEGVANVVARLLDIVQPHRLYMGQKDYQQVAIVRAMLKQISSRTELVMCPTMREKDGLAMSSRNMKLTERHRQAAPLIYQGLTKARQMTENSSVQKIKELFFKLLDVPDLSPEYFEIVDGDSLLSVKDLSENNFVVACTAVWAGDVRLIDNMILKKIDV